MPNHRIPIAGDHAAPELKEKLIQALPEFKFDDLGVKTTDRVDYPDYAAKVAELVSSGKAERGILLCGSGIGMAIAANKFPGVRAAVVETVEAAKLAREHNDANILALGARLLTPEKAIEITKAFLNTPFSQGERHIGRIKKIAELDRK